MHIYDHIGPAKFLVYKEKLTALERRIKDWVHKAGLSITHPKYHEVALAININWSAGEYHGNMGVLYIDEPGPRLFTVYVIKTIDVDQFRHYRKHDIIDRVPLKVIEEKWIDFFQEGVQMWNSWSQDDLVESTKLPPRLSD